MFVFFIVLYFVSICRLAFDKCNNHPEPKGGLVHIMAGTMAVGRQQIITVGSSHQVMVMGSWAPMVMGSWAPKAKALAMNGQLMLMGLKSRKRTQLQSRVGHIQAHGLCSLLTACWLYFASVWLSCYTWQIFFGYFFDLCILGAQHIFYIPWPGTIAATFPPVDSDLSFKNVQNDFAQAGIHMQTRNLTKGRDFGLEASSVKHTRRSEKKDLTISANPICNSAFLLWIHDWIHSCFCLC